MYPREDSEQQSEATFNVFQKGIKWLSELSEIATCPCPWQRNGLSFSTISGRALSAKGTFFPLLFRATFWSAWASVNTLRAGMWLHWRFCVPLNTYVGYCTWKELREFSDFKGSSKNWRVHASLISNGTPHSWFFGSASLMPWTLSLTLQVRKLRLSEASQFPKATYLVRERELLWKPTYVKLLAHALCLPGWSKLCFRLLQKLDQNGNRDQEEVGLWWEYNRRYCRISSERRHI